MALRKVLRVPKHLSLTSSTLLLFLALPLFFLMPVKWTDQWSLNDSRISSSWLRRDVPRELLSHPRIPATRLCAELKTSDAPFIIDVRSQPAYEEGHIPGAVRLPIGKIAAAKKELPNDRLIVLYDDWPEEHYAANQVGYMQRNGMNQLDLRVLDGGIEAWRQTECGVKVGDTP